MKRHILFVEDNPILLQLYGTMLSKDGNWETATCDSGEAAVNILQRNTFEVVVSDLRMPGMDGVQVMRAVKQLQPNAARVILSGLNDQQEIAECLGETHQFIAKPFSAKTLRSTLASLCRLDAYLQDKNLRSLAARLGTLPSFPSLYLDIMQELATETPSIENIANLVAQDPGLTAKMLQVVNSAALGLEQPVSNTVEAVQHLGTSTVRSIALSAHVFSSFEKNSPRGFSVSALWNHALNTAKLAQTFMRRSGAESGDTENAFTAGMLHDLGKLLLAANLPDQFTAAVELAGAKNLPLHEAEREVFGATHADIGAYLLGLWGLPAPIVEAVAFHHTPGQSENWTPNALTSVHVASVLEHELFSAEPPGPIAKLDDAYLEAVGIQPQLSSWRQFARIMREKASD